MRVTAVNDCGSAAFAAKGTPVFGRVSAHGPIQLVLCIIGVVNSFVCYFVWVLWPAYQVRSAVAAKPLAGSTASDHDSPNAPVTARSVYVIAYTAAQPARLEPRFCVGAVAPCDRDLRNKDTAACCRVSVGYCCQQLWFSGPGRLFASVS